MFFNLGATGITEPEKLGDFVERFAGGIVHRSADQLIVAKTAHQDRHRMSAAGDERNVSFNFRRGTVFQTVFVIRHGQDARATKKRREQVTFKMVDCEVRLAKANGQAFSD